jgi:hypothetical protein
MMFPREAGRIEKRGPIRAAARWSEQTLFEGRYLSETNARFCGGTTRPSAGRRSTPAIRLPAEPNPMPRAF